LEKIYEAYGTGTTLYKLKEYSGSYLNMLGQYESCIEEFTYTLELIHDPLMF